MNEELTAEEFAEFLMNMRTSINQTKYRFAKELGVRESTYHQWEKGTYRPKEYERIINSVRVLVKQKIRECA